MTDARSAILLTLLLLAPLASAERDGNMLRGTLQHDGIEREYFIHLPPDYQQRNSNVPLVVAIHGYTSTATGFQVAHGLNRHADENGYAVVYPQGSHFAVDDGNGGSFRITSWNDLAANQPQTAAGPHCTEDRWQYPCPPDCGSCNRCDWTSCNDDVGFIERMLDEVQDDYAFDTDRTYLLGVSNGGMMALRLGCNLPERFAAIAPIIAQLAPGYACGPEIDVPMLHLYGKKDDTVRYDGKPAQDGFIYTTAEETAEVWAGAMACNNGPAPWENTFSDSGGLACTAYSDCNAEGHEVVSCMDPVAAHEWPGQGVAGMPATCVTEEQFDSIPGQAHCSTADGEYAHNGMDLIWDFMRRYSR